MFNKIKVLLAKWRLRNWFVPAENHQLSRLGNLYGVNRYVYTMKNDDTEDYPVYIVIVENGVPLSGWLENDEHYRKRIRSSLSWREI